MNAAHAISYQGSSSLAGSTLSLVTEARTSVAPAFFRGRLRQPRLSADLLTAVALVVGSRFYTPPNAKARQFTDPIVTAGAGVLRFEGFSACASAWIRLDVDSDGYEGDIVGHGTTNVDFNPALRQALARVRDSDVLGFDVGSTALTLQHDDVAVVEKKVPLPPRWLRSLVEVQSYLSSMTPRLTVSGPVALRFLRSLPRTTTKNTPLWVVPAAAGLRLTATPDAAGVRFTDVARLRVLEPLAARATSLRMYADDNGMCSAWVLSFAGMRLTLAMTAEVWRGFSGEGQALRALLRTDTADVIARVRGALSWQQLVDADAIAADLGIANDLVDDTLRVLGTSGLVGYDLHAQRYFHRVLPFDLDSIADFNPRLVAARALVDAGAVVIDADGNGAVVASGDVGYSLSSRASARRQTPKRVSLRASYRVKVNDDDDDDSEGARCTCPWFAKHQGERGDCKHVLAFELCRNLHIHTRP